MGQRRFGWRSGCLVAVAVVWSAVALGADRPEEWTLDDGTQVLLMEDPDASWAYLGIEFPVGRWSAWARTNPAREAFEIQLFDPAGALRQRADSLAVHLTVRMNDRNAWIYGSSLAEDFAHLADLMRSVLGNRDFDRAELRRWRTLRRLEWQRLNRDPAFLRHQAGLRAVFATGDPRRLRHEPPAKVATDVKRLATVRDAILRLPGRTVGIAGRVSRAEAEQILADLLPAAAPGDDLRLAPNYLPLESVRQGSAATVELPRLTQVYLAMVRDSIPYDHPDYPAYRVAAHIVGGHPYSRLANALRHDEGDTYDASATAPRSPVPELFQITTFTRTSNAAGAERKMRGVLTTLHRSGITAVELDEAVSYLAGRRLFARQTPVDALGRLMRERRYGLRDGFFDGVADRAAELTVADVNAFIRRFFDPALFTVIRVVSESDAGRPSPP